MSTLLPRPENLAALIDSRQDLREMLSTNFNLAHAVLLLRRSELESVERALELALAKGNADADIVAECIRIEMVRLDGHLAEAIQRAEALATRERFNTLAVLYYRHLFPLMDPAHAVDAAETVSPGAFPPPAQELLTEAGESPSVANERSAVADHQEEEAPVSSALDLPTAWQKVGEDPAVEFLRITDASGSKEVRRAEIGTGVLDELAFGLANRIMERLSFGPLKHGAFEGADKVIHSWKRDGLKVAAVIQAGSSASLLAARCSRAFEDHR